MEASDLTASEGVGLSAEAGWNQTEDDWRVFLAHGSVFSRREEGFAVASAAALPYAEFGFVSMVLTTRLYRGRGLAGRLVTDAVAMLNGAGLDPVLDATPAGRAVYQRQGFFDMDTIERWARPSPPPLAGGGRGEGARHSDHGSPGTAPPNPLPPGEGEFVASLDAVAFGARRDFLLRDFLTRLRTVSVIDPTGFCLARTGRLATQIGPLVAADELAAIALLGDLNARIAEPAIIDVPTRWHQLAAWLAAHGFARQRPFTRMAQGRLEPFGDPARLFATAGPEFG